MSNRWVALAVLFVVRLSMGFQFQSIASTSDFLIADWAISFTPIGMRPLMERVLSRRDILKAQNASDNKAVTKAYAGREAGNYT